MKIKSYNVIPNLPESISTLRDIAMNIWSTWNWQAGQLFIRLDAETWENSRQNLVKILGQIPQDVLERVAKDDSFTANLDRVYNDLRSYLEAPTWFDDNSDQNRSINIAYFSMEFGLDVSLPVYSGGLGVLAGDHLKSASDLGIPLTGVGLMYQQGYFQQYLNSDGWQMERYPVNDWHSMPVSLQRGEDGKPLTISVNLAEETLYAHIWKVETGRIALYLLDANISENPPHLRQITAQLYGGDRDNRIQQEILLGIGGIRALDALGIKPTVFHMNEGHSAFLALERLRRLIRNQGLSYDEALEVVWATTVFTTHTPVPAGNETFSPDRVRHYFARRAEELTLSWDKFLSLGQEQMGANTFSMTILALKMSAHCNGVSRLHGDVSRKMWRSLWKGLPLHEVPIRHITNGIHTKTWISHDLDELMTRYIGPHFLEEAVDRKLWNRIDSIPDLELWRIHLIRKERLIFFARKKLKQQLERRGAGILAVGEAGEVLDSGALTIGFARRFATYKRANLLLSNPERLKRLLMNQEHPVQFIFAGKAHPHDDAGKEFIRRIIHFAADPAIRRRFVFIEDYNINTARYMVQGVDVWLATSRRPLEASGTSGMKAAANGAINVGTLDGWWDEAYDPSVGWAIGSGEANGNPDELDRIEAEALFNLLEKDIIPAYFDHDRTQIPRQWISLMKRSMKEIGQFFNTHRMVREYYQKLYMSAHRAGENLTKDTNQRAKNLSAWRGMVSQHWPQVTIQSEDLSADMEVMSGNTLPVRAKVRLNNLSPGDIAVEVMYGELDSQGEIVDGKTLRLDYQGEKDGFAIFESAIPCLSGGRQGYATRIRPDNQDLVHPFTPLLMLWE